MGCVEVQQGDAGPRFSADLCDQAATFPDHG